jgi:hypothetical protein
MGEIFSIRLNLPAIFHALPTIKSSRITHSVQHFAVHHTTAVNGAGAGVLHTPTVALVFFVVYCIYALMRTLPV